MSTPDQPPISSRRRAARQRAWSRKSAAGPVGNAGGAAIGALAVLSIADDLRDLLGGAS